MAHVRRKFVSVFASQGNAIAEEAIRRIAELYAVEKDALGKSPDARVALRQSRSKLIFDDLEAWLTWVLAQIADHKITRQGQTGRVQRTGTIKIIIC